MFEDILLKFILCLVSVLLKETKNGNDFDTDKETKMFLQLLLHNTQQKFSKNASNQQKMDRKIPRAKIPIPIPLSFVKNISNNSPCFNHTKRFNV